LATKYQRTISPERQEYDLRAYANRCGYDVVGVGKKLHQAVRMRIAKKILDDHGAIEMMPSW
jgi:hypothetical protein